VKLLTEQVEDLIDRIELNYMDQKLTLRKESGGELLDKEVILRVGKEMKTNYYVVSAGLQGEHLVFDAYDKDRDVRLELRIRSQNSVHKKSETPSYQYVESLVKRLDVQTVGITMFDSL